MNPDELPADSQDSAANEQTTGTSDGHLRLDLTFMLTLPKRIADLQDSVFKAIGQTSAANRNAVANVLAKLEAIEQRLDVRHDFAPVLQKHLQAIEAEQRRLSDQVLRQFYLKRLASRLLGIRRSVICFRPGEFAVNALCEEVAATLADFDIELIAPEPGDPFDPRTMKPTCVMRKEAGQPLLVERLDLPGARHGEFVLEYARVQVGCRTHQEPDADDHLREPAPHQETEAEKDKFRRGDGLLSSIPSSNESEQERQDDDSEHDDRN